MISFKFMLPQISPKSEVTFWPGVIGICILFYSAQISIRYISWLSTIVGSQSHSWSFPMHTLIVREKMDRICPCCWTRPPPHTCPHVQAPLQCSPVPASRHTSRADTGPSAQMGDFCVCLWVRFQVQLWGVFPLSSSRPRYLCPYRVYDFVIIKSI